MLRRSRSIAIIVLLLSTFAPSLATAAERRKYETQAAEVQHWIQQNLYDQKSGLYFVSTKKHNADFMWGNGISFSSLVAASRHDPQTYQPIMSRFFKSMDRYWDKKAPIPGYEPSPTNGNGNDKYYDDNEWMVIAFAEAYEQTHEPQYLNASEAALKFSLSGWDDTLGGGIWWHETHKGGGKNTCSNAPAAEGCLRVARYLPTGEARKSIDMAAKIVDWTWIAKTPSRKRRTAANSPTTPP